MSKVTFPLTGHAYSDDGSTERDMLDGGHTEYLLPMLQETVDTATLIVSKVDSASDSQAAAEASAADAGEKAAQATADRVAAETAAAAAHADAERIAIPLLAGAAGSVLGVSPDESGMVWTDISGLARKTDLGDPAKGAEMVAFSQAGEGAVARTIRDELRDWISVKQFGVKADGVSDDSDCMARAISFAIENFPTGIEVPAGCIYMNKVLPPYTRPFAMRGAGFRSSLLRFGPDAVGNCMTLQNVGFSDETTDLPKDGNTAWNSLADVRAGSVLMDFSIVGDRRCEQRQHGLVLQGNVDHVNISRIGVMYFRGRGFWGGQNYTDSNGVETSGYMRECNVTDIKIRACGDTDGTASFGLYHNDSPGGATDSSNLCNFTNVDIVFPYGKAFEVADLRTANISVAMYGLKFRNIMVHGRYGDFSANGRLVSIIGAVAGCEYDINIAYSGNRDYVVELLANPDIPAAYPYDSEMSLRMPSVVKGVYVGGIGANFNIRYRSYFGQGEALAFKSLTSAPIMKIECETDNMYMVVPNGMIFNGSTPIQITGWTMNTMPALATFFPKFNPDGVGDTTRAQIMGVLGTITRTGSVAASTDMYMFTPDAATNAYAPPGEYMSKFMVNGSHANTVSGRYAFVPEFRYGVGVNSAWNSTRLLRMNPWQIHIENSTSLIRMSYGKPTADNGGIPLAPWKSAFVGGSPTPSVGGISKLVANYGAPTTLTNMTGGVDGQTVRLIATNANCTVENNANIQTTTGGNVAMTSGQVLSFTYDTTLGKWCGG